MTFEESGYAACTILSAAEHVLLNPDLLNHIFKLVTPAEGFCLRERAQLAGVCTTWRHMLQTHVPAALNLGADSPPAVLSSLLHGAFSNIKTIKVESEAPSVVQARVVQLLRTESLRRFSRHSLETLTGVLLYGSAFAELADRFPKLSTLVCRSFWGNEQSKTWLPHHVQELDFALDSRFRISNLARGHVGGRFLEGCPSLRCLTLRNFSQVSLAYVPPTLEHFTFYEARDVSNAETLEMASDTSGLERLTIHMPGGRSRDRRSGRKVEAAKVTPSDHWSFARVVEYVAAPGQSVEVQPGGMNIGWATAAPDGVDQAKAARDFATGFLDSPAQEVSFRTGSFRLTISVELQNDLLRPYISHGITGEELAVHIKRDFGRVLDCEATVERFALRRVNPSNRRNTG